MADLIQPTHESASEAPSEHEGPPLPVGFVGHGAPTLAIDPVKGAELAAFARSFPEPRAVLVVSAHWETRAPTIGTTQPRPLVPSPSTATTSSHGAAAMCPPPNGSG